MKKSEGSLRDPQGRVYLHQGKILRQIYPQAIAEFQAVRKTSLIQQLIAENDLVNETYREDLASEGYIFEHPRLPVTTYPYEWTFGALKEAALFHLELQIKALAYNVSLHDASSYNVQFIGCKPIFIDHAAFKLYQEGEYWFGLKQFYQEFLYPLYGQAYGAFPFQDVYRSQLSGIEAESLLNFLPKTSYLNLACVRNILLPCFFENKSKITPDVLRKYPLPKKHYLKQLQKLKNTIAKLSPKFKTRSFWQHYEQDKPYHAIAAQQKLKIVSEFIREHQIKQLWDLGCNTGEYAASALNSGAELVIGIDQDLVSLEKAYQRAQNENLKFFPIYNNLLNPSPNQGVAQKERQGLMERMDQADGILALALLHHLTIPHGLGFAVILPWLVSLAPKGLIEFVHETDEQVQEMLAFLPAMQTQYHYAHFKETLQQSARIIAEYPLAEMRRTLVIYER